MRRPGSLAGDILGRHLLLESLTEHRAKFLCATQVSLQAELQIYLIVRCFIYYHSALHQLHLLPAVNKLQ